MRKKRSQKDVYCHLKSFAEVSGMTKENTSMITVLLQPGCEFKEEKLLQLVRKLLKPLNREYAVVIEPVVAEPDLYAAANFDSYREHLPFYHAHILIKEFDRELRSLNEEWFKLIGKSRKRLFHVCHIKDSISAAINYMTKYYEIKRETNPLFKIVETAQIERKEELIMKNVPKEQPAIENQYFPIKIKSKVNWPKKLIVRIFSYAIMTFSVIRSILTEISSNNST